MNDKKIINQNNFNKQVKMRKRISNDINYKNNIFNNNINNNINNKNNNNNNINKRFGNLKNKEKKIKLLPKQNNNINDNNLINQNFEYKRCDTKDNKNPDGRYLRLFDKNDKNDNKNDNNNNNINIFSSSLKINKNVKLKLKKNGAKILFIKKDNNFDFLPAIHNKQNNNNNNINNNNHNDNNQNKDNNNIKVNILKLSLRKSDIEENNKDNDNKDNNKPKKLKIVHNKINLLNMNAISKNPLQNNFFYNNNFNINYGNRPNSRYENHSKFNNNNNNNNNNKRPTTAISQALTTGKNNNKTKQYYFPNKQFNNKNNSNNNNKNIYSIKSFYSNSNQNEEFRKEMEDFILIKDKIISNPEHTISIFAIFDGHNGKIVSEFLSNNFHEFFKKNLTEFNYKIEETLIQSFIDIDKKLKELNNSKDKGSTATVIIIDNSILYCANVGDSRGYFIKKNKLIQLTKDHNCFNNEEVKRVEKANGKVFRQRVFGVLQLTRSIGDLDLKDYGVICTPFISKMNIKKDSQFCVIASDGVWDKMGIDEIEEFIKNNQSINSQILCDYLVNTSLEKYTRDNVACVVIQFN